VNWAARRFCAPQFNLGAYGQIQGWLLKLEKGGIRRVLMNVFGNSLKFTTVFLFSCQTLPSEILIKLGRMATCT
jgi:hypothetical protein